MLGYRLLCQGTLTELQFDACSCALQAASKIVCTLGPACRDVETLMELINAGMTAARVDLTVRRGCCCATHGQLRPISTSSSHPATAADRLNVLHLLRTARLQGPYERR